MQYQFNIDITKRTAGETTIYALHFNNEEGLTRLVITEAQAIQLILELGLVEKELGKKGATIYVKNEIKEISDLRNTVLVPPIYGVPAKLIDSYMPFTGKEIHLVDVAHTFLGRGQWHLKVLLSINGKALSLKIKTTDSQLIDEWYHDDRQLNQETIATAVERVLRDNEDVLEDFDEFDQ